jgi:hypothetical protein
MENTTEEPAEIVRTVRDCPHADIGLTEREYLIIEAVNQWERAEYDEEERADLLAWRELHAQFNTWQEEGDKWFRDPENRDEEDRIAYETFQHLAKLLPFMRRDAKIKAPH